MPQNRLPSGKIRHDVVLCGSLCSGKTTLARRLASHGYSVVTAVDAIESHSGRTRLSRSELQQVGLELERAAPGKWLAEAAAAAARPVVLDAVRTPAQLAASRVSLNCPLVVFLSASLEVRRARFERRVAVRESDLGVPFDAVAGTQLESDAERLAPLADLRLQTDQMSADDVERIVLERFPQEAETHSTGGGT